MYSSLSWMEAGRWLFVFWVRITSQGDGTGGNHSSNVNSFLLSDSLCNRGFQKIFICCCLAPYKTEGFQKILIYSKINKNIFFKLSMKYLGSNMYFGVICVWKGRRGLFTAESWFCSSYMTEVTISLDDLSHLSAFHQIKGNVCIELAAKDDLKIIFIFSITRQHAKNNWLPQCKAAMQMYARSLLHQQKTPLLKLN